MRLRPACPLPRLHHERDGEVDGGVGGAFHGLADGVDGGLGLGLGGLEEEFVVDLEEHLAG